MKRRKDKMLANMKFIGNLFLRQLLAVKAPGPGSACPAHVFFCGERCSAESREHDSAKRAYGGSAIPILSHLMLYYATHKAELHTTREDPTHACCRTLLRSSGKSCTTSLGSRRACPRSAPISSQTESQP